MSKISYGIYFLLLLAFAIYSSTSVFIKLAALHPIMSLPFFIFYSFAILALGIYAVLWQIILKKMPLSVAFMSKSITIIFGLSVAYFLFSEIVTINNLIGSLFIITGIILLPWKR